MSDLINQSTAGKYLECVSWQADRNRVLLSWLDKASESKPCETQSPAPLPVIKMSQILQQGFVHVEVLSKETYFHHQDGGYMVIDTTLYGEDGEERYETDVWYVDKDGTQFTVEVDTKLPKKA